MYCLIDHSFFKEKQKEVLRGQLVKFFLSDILGWDGNYEFHATSWERQNLFDNPIEMHNHYHISA